MTFITTAEMDALGIAVWGALAAAEKERAVAQANAYLGTKSFVEWDDQPPPVTVAAQELALLAGEARLYADATTGTINRKRVKADTVETETQWADGGVSIPGALAYAEALIRPFLAGGGGSTFAVRRA